MAPKGKRKALVCGASQGIGQAIAQELARSGYEVTALARNEAKLKALIGELDGEGHDYISADLGNTEDLKLQIDQALIRGNYTVLICNGGGPKPGLISEVSTSDFEKAFREHVLANTVLVQKLLPGMKEEKFGRIINIISTSVKAPIPSLLVSNTIRAAMASWAKTLAGELGPFGITVNNILPGYTKTERMDALLAASAQRTGQSIGEVKKTWLDSIPAKRFGEVSEIADAVAFLASEKAGYINGINVPIDGGRTPTL